MGVLSARKSARRTTVRKIRSHLGPQLTGLHHALRNPIAGIEPGMVILDKWTRRVRAPDELCNNLLHKLRFDALVWVASSRSVKIAFVHAPILPSGLGPRRNQ